MVVEKFKCRVVVFLGFIIGNNCFVIEVFDWMVIIVRSM